MKAASRYPRCEYCTALWGTKEMLRESSKFPALGLKLQHDTTAESLVSFILPLPVLFFLSLSYPSPLTTHASLNNQITEHPRSPPLIKRRRDNQNHVRKIKTEYRRRTNSPSHAFSFFFPLYRPTCGTHPLKTNGEEDQGNSTPRIKSPPQS